MEYERIEKPACTSKGSGFSPQRLRTMLMGVERRLKEGAEAPPEEEKDDSGDPSGNMSEECKDIDVVSSYSESSSSLEATGSGHRCSRVRILEDDSCDSESVASNFEFHKERAPSRAAAAVVPPFSKPAPSKWDDAQKWIASPNCSLRPASGGVTAQIKKAEKPGVAGRHPVAKVVVEAASQVADPVPEKKDLLGWQKGYNLQTDIHPGVAPTNSSVALSRHDAPTTQQSSTAFVPSPSTVRSVSMRDMGTEMTPAASQEPSRTGTPARAASPSASKPSTPPRSTISCVLSHAECSTGELSEKELQVKTRKEILLLGTQLGKTSITAWASKQEEQNDAACSLKKLAAEEQTVQNMAEIRAAAWEGAEKAKYVARFKREEIKIQAWEDHQRAKIEAEMRKIEVEVEKMKSNAQDKMMSQLASARHKAEERLAAAEAKRHAAFARTAEQADGIRRTGRAPRPPHSCWGWCS